MPAHLYKGTDFRANPTNQAPVGTGPFKFKEWKKGEYIHLVRNDAYWQSGKPHLDAIYYRFIPDSASRALALETGQVQLAAQTDIEFVDVARLGKMPGLVVTTKGWEWNSTISWIELNSRRKPFDDPRFRRAVLHALDREFIRTNIFFGLAKEATGPAFSSRYDPNVPASVRSRQGGSLARRDGPEAGRQRRARPGQAAGPALASCGTACRNTSARRSASRHPGDWKARTSPAGTTASPTGFT
jgi:ABC-type transport system substrate-binding protein